MGSAYNRANTIVMGLALMWAFPASITCFVGRDFIWNRDVEISSVTQKIDSEIVVELISWIVLRTGWTKKEKPVINLVPPEKIATICGNGHTKACFAHKGRTIYLPQTWDAKNLRDRAALLHELVHYLQVLNSIEAKCAAAYEKDAYRLTIVWLQQHGVSEPYQFLNIDKFTIGIYSACPEPEE